MVMRAVRLSIVLTGLGFAAGCADGDHDVARVTIDMPCGSDRDCPTGFRCEADADHGPPITLCESSDPAITCPPGYVTSGRIGQVFCKQRGRVGARSGRGSTSITARGADRLGHGRGGTGL